MELGNDLRYAWRQLRRSPGFAAAAVLTLALGIGATTTMFSVVDQVLLRPLPFVHPSQLVTITEASYDKDAASGGGGIPLPDAEDWQTRSHTLQSVAYYTFNMPIVGGIARPRSESQLITSTNFLNLLGVQPAMGRGFAADENAGGRTHVVVLGSEAWHTLFGSDPKIVGRVVTLNGTPHTVIGVMPESFRFQGSSDFLFSPLDVTDKNLQDRGSGMLTVLGRLRAGSTLEDAMHELAGIKQQNLRAYAGKERDNRVIVEDYARSLTRNVRPGLVTLNGLILAVWLLATINVAGLLLTRTQGRRREIAVRAALGAGSARLMRQFLVESLLLSLAGGAIGLGITSAALRISRSYLANTFQNGELIHIDTTVCVYALLASCVSALLFGIIPALQAARLPILSGLREGSAGSGTSRSQSLMRDTIVTVEVALSLLLLVAAGVMAHTLYEMQRRPLGFNPEKVVTAELMLPQKSYWFAGQSSGKNIIPALIEPMLDRIRQLPGVTAAGVTTVRPLRTNWSFVDQIHFAGRPKPDPRHEQSANLRAATADYFRAMGVPLKQGRLFNQDDSAGAPLAAVVNEAFTQQIDGARSPIGMQVEAGEAGPHKYATIVGVVADARQGMNESVKPELLLNLSQMSPADDMYPILVSFHLDLVVRAQMQSESLIPTITRIVHDLNPDVGVNHAEPMQTTVDDTMGSQTLAARLLSLFALAALVIAAAGLYGLLAYQVTQQLRDFGVRLALGAERKDVLWLVLGRAVRLLITGAVLGIAASLVLSRVAASMLTGIDIHNIVLVIEAVTLILAVTCITASYLPARRAAQTDPMQALRHE
ncbi:MAG TPA: ABC transporter permease [Acidobacteriaceae bacterium]|jgi:predicted permease|nr:ABC transporter permease [Acidobacteriaceae bacterium]